MNRQYERYLKIILICLDLLFLNVILILSETTLVKSISLEYKNSYNVYWKVANAGWIILCFFAGTYSKKIILSFIFFTKRTIQTYIFWIILLLCYLFFSRELLLSRIYIGITVVGFGMGLLANRFLYLAISKYLKKSKSMVKKVLIPGLNDTAKNLRGTWKMKGLIQN